MSEQPTPPPDRTPPPRLVVLGLVFLLMALARGASETFTVFLLPISNEFGWDRAQTVSVYSIGALMRRPRRRRSSGGCSITPGRARFMRSASS